LNISGVIRNAGNLTWTGGGNLELSGQSIFAGGVTAPSGAGLVLGGNSTPSAALTFPTSGPLGSGTLTINSGANILAAAASTVSNAVTVGGNFNFAGVTAVTLNGPITLPSNTTTAINVAAPQMIATLGGNLNGANAVLSKTGYGNLVLGGVMSSLGAATVNGGALTLAGQNTANPQPLAFGGTVTLNNGILQLANNGAQPNSLIYLNDNVVVNNASQGFISVNNNGANTGSTFVLPNLTYSGLSSNATVLSVTGANGYNLKVNNTNLNNYASPVTFNIAAGVTVTLPGVFGASNTPLNVGPGTLLFAGANAGSLAYSVTGTKQINPAANASGYQFGTNGAIQLGAGSTLQVMPEFNSSTPLSNSGYTSGGLAGKYYSESAASAIFSAQTSGVLPSAVLPSQQPADASLAIRPVVVANNTSFSTDMAIYNGLLNLNVRRFSDGF
jgi:hypothetical protein